MKIGSECFPISTFAGIGAALGILLAFQIAYCYLSYRRRKNDEVWHVNPEELELSHPVEVIGQGAFGVVLAAEYRGTRVAIKRVIPPQNGAGSKKVSSRQGNSASAIVLASTGSNDLAGDNGGDDPEVGGVGSVAATNSVSNSRDTTGSDSNLDDGFFGGFHNSHKKTRLQRLFPGLFHSEISRANLSLLGTASGGTTTRSVWFRFLPRCDETARRQQEFQNEMRLLSRLRHPCKYLLTVFSNFLLQTSLTQSASLL